MAIIPVRDLGAIGVVTDRAAYDVPLNGFTRARNVIFAEGRMERGPVFKKVVESLTPDTCHLLYTVRRPAAADRALLVDDTGMIYEYSGSTETDITASAFTPLASDEPVTATTLQDVVYINRPTDVPYSWLTADAEFIALTNWDTGWRCRSLRSYKDCLIALNMEESGVEYQKRVRWSEFALYGSPPATWVPDTTNSAGSNDLADLEMPIVDGLPLRDQFVIYSNSEAYLMTFIAGKLVFAFRKLWNDVGVINTNCIVEVDGQHVVFGQDDIITHDTGSKRSIADGRVKKRIFNNIDRDKTDRCFTFHATDRDEVWFCYTSMHADVNFSGSDYANEAAVWNYSNDTWTFLDLPNVGGATNVALSQGGYTWAASSGTTWEDDTGTWADIESNIRRLPLFGVTTNSGLGLTEKVLLTADGLNFSAKTPYELYSEASCYALAENGMIDLDQMGFSLASFKMVLALYPQASTAGNTGYLGFRFGGAMTPAASPTLGPLRTFDPVAEHKVAVRGGGRYGSWQVSATDTTDFWMSGFDLDVVQTGRR